MILGQDIQELSICLWITALFDLLDILDSRFYRLSVHAVRPRIGRLNRRVHTYIELIANCDDD